MLQRSGDGAVIRPVSNAEAERLIHLAEEASEVVHACMKVLRHGWDDRRWGSSLSNRQELALEVGNLQFLLQQMLAAQDIDPDWVESGALVKKRNWNGYTYHQEKEHESSDTASADCGGNQDRPAGVAGVSG